MIYSWKSADISPLYVFATSFIVVFLLHAWRLSLIRTNPILLFLCQEVQPTWSLKSGLQHKRNRNLVTQEA